MFEALHVSRQVGVCVKRHWVRLRLYQAFSDLFHFDDDPMARPLSLDVELVTALRGVEDVRRDEQILVLQIPRLSAWDHRLAPWIADDHRLRHWCVELTVLEARPRAGVKLASFNPHRLSRRPKYPQRLGRAGRPVVGCGNPNGSDTGNEVDPGQGITLRRRRARQQLRPDEQVKNEGHAAGASSILLACAWHPSTVKSVS